MGAQRLRRFGVPTPPGQHLGIPSIPHIPSRNLRFLSFLYSLIFLQRTRKLMAKSCHRLLPGRRMWFGQDGGCDCVWQLATPNIPQSCVFTSPRSNSYDHVMYHVPCGALSVYMDMRVIENPRWYSSLGLQHWVLVVFSPHGDVEAKGRWHTHIPADAAAHGHICHVACSMPCKPTIVHEA